MFGLKGAHVAPFYSLPHLPVIVQKIDAAPVMSPIGLWSSGLRRELSIFTITILMFLKPYMIVAGQRAVSICVTVFLQPRVSPPGGCKKESRLQVLMHRSLFRPKGNVHRLMILYAFCHMTTRGLTHSLACFLFIGGYCLDKNFQMRL